MRTGNKSSRTETQGETAKDNAGGRGIADPLTTIAHGARILVQA
jgi:hypothetical protein